MKKTLTFLPLFLVALLAFVAVWWFSRGDDGANLNIDVDPQQVLQIGDSGETQHFSARRDLMPTSDHVDDLDPAAVGAGDPNLGELYVEGKLAAKTPPELVVEIYPAATERRQLAEGTLFAQLEPGLYRITLYGGDIVPIYHADIRIEAGKRRSLKFELERGLRFKGQVLSANPEEAIPYASVDFNGQGSVRCDGEGFFEVAPRLARYALSKITVSAEGWDTQIYHQLSIVDPENIQLYLGRGKRSVTLDVVNRTTDELPDDWLVRVTIAPLYTTRREVKVTGTQNRIELENLYATNHYRFELHFPGGEFPTQRQKLRIELGEEHRVLRFVIEEGAEILAEAVGPEILKQQIELQLRDVHNDVLARGPIRKDGTFRLNHVSAGSYFLFLISGSQARSIGKLKLNGRERLRLKIDLLRHKVQRI